MQATTITRREAKTFGDEITAIVAAKRSSVHVGTWMDRQGVSIAIHFDSKNTGLRAVIHKWDDEETCSVRYIKGDFWRDPDNAVEYAASDGVSFTAVDVAHEIAAQRER